MGPLLLLMLVGGATLSAFILASRGGGHRGVTAARTLLEQGNTEAAERRFRILARTLDFGREHEEACIGWAIALEQLDKLPDALQIYERYLALYERSGRGTPSLVKRATNRTRQLRNELERAPEVVHTVSPDPANDRATPRGRLVNGASLASPDARIRVRDTSDLDSPRITLRPREPTQLQSSDFSSTQSQEPVSSPWRELRPELAERRVGRYVLGEKLGEGGFGEVITAYLPVAIKFAKSPEAVSYLERLARLQGKVKSPRIVAPIELDLEASPPYMVMEFVDGPTVQELLRFHERLPVPEACRLIYEIALGLRDAHNAGVLHLDLKPANVLIEASGQIKITDFELGADQSAEARARLAQSLISVADESLKGTVAYMSPEQREGKSLDSRSDIYTLGVMLFELLTGELPQPGDRPSEFVPDLPARVDSVFQKCFARYERRYANIEDFITELGLAADGLLKHADLASFVSRVPAPVRTTEPNRLDVGPEPDTVSSTERSADRPDSPARQAEFTPSPAIQSTPRVPLTELVDPQRPPQSSSRPSLDSVIEREAEERLRLARERLASVDTKPHIALDQIEAAGGSAPADQSEARRGLEAN